MLKFLMLLNEISGNCTLFLLVKICILSSLHIVVQVQFTSVYVSVESVGDGTRVVESIVVVLIVDEAVELVVKVSAMVGVMKSVVVPTTDVVGE